MAVVNTLTKTALNFKYKDGVDGAGNDIIKAKKFSNVKVTAADQSIYDTAEAFSSLLKYPYWEAQRTDDSALTNQ